MRTILLLAFILIAFSCEDEIQPRNTPIIPVWLETRIAELEAESNCNGCVAKQINIEQEIYYHVYCNHWSCSHCEVYMPDGSLVNWEEQSLSDFLQNQTRSIILWKCQSKEAE